MDSKRAILILSMVLAALLLAACNLTTPTQPATDPGEVYTQAAQTIVAGLTQTAEIPLDNNAIYTQVAQTVAAQLTQDSAVQTQNAPTLTPTATATSIPTATPFPTFTPVTPSPTPQLTPCDAAKFIADVSVPDGTIFPPNARFTKTWRLQNVGLCTWNGLYSLVFVSGERMGAANVIPLSGNVVPGQTVDISVDMIAPNNSGNYRGNWMLRNPQGDIFGIGDNYDKSFWVSIKVAQPQSDYEYDFVYNVCEASWSSETNSPLPCPGSLGDSQGYILLIDRPALETGKIENEPALLTVPNNNANGYIEGRFRDIRIRDGYHFRSGIMCADNSKGCDVIFSVSYRISGGQRVELGSWREVYDNNYNVVDVNLSFLAGNNIDIFLKVTANDNKRNNNALWWVPRIEKR